MHRSLLRHRWILLAVLAAVAAVPVVIALRVPRPQPVRLENEQWVAVEDAYAGVEACRDCHASEVEQQLASNMAQTLRDLSQEPPRAPFSNGDVVVDSSTGARYSMEKTASGYEIFVRLGERAASMPVSFEFGSGAHAFGYQIRVDEDNWIDARLNYHRSIQGWDWTSSQDKPHKYLTKQPLGRPQVKKEVVRCFSCHTTKLVAAGVQAAPVEGNQLHLRLDKSVLGVTCEACHGPRAAHVRARRRAEAPDAGQDLSPAAQNRICGRCHGFDNVNPAHPVITRFQPLRLSKSRCFIASQGKLGCTTCHNPHQNVVKDPAFYTRRCKSCHNGSAGSIAHAVCPVNQERVCVKCHMPRDSRSMLHMTFTDHLIRVLKNSGRRGAEPLEE